MSSVTPGELDLDALRAQDRLGLLDGVDRAVVYDVPLTTRFRGQDGRDGVLLHGPAGWGEAAPFWDHAPDHASCWLASALESARGASLDGEPLPAPLRQAVPVNVTVPEVSPERAHALVALSGCHTAKVKVATDATAPGAQARDLARLEAVRDALGPGGKVRVDVNGGWDLDLALHLLPLMDRAAGGLEYVEQPCRGVEDLAALRRATHVPVAADESVRLAADPMDVVRHQAADLVVIKAAPLGGVRAALRLVERLGLPAVVSSALDTSVGLATGVRLAATLPELAGACGLGTGRLLARDVAVPALVPLSGELPVRPLHVSRSLLATAAATAEVTARWQVRMGHLLGALTARREAGQA